MTEQHQKLKTCYKCKVEYGLTAGFSRDKSKPDGFCRKCKACSTAAYNARKHIYSERAKAYRREHRDRDRITRTSYWHKHFFYVRSTNLLGRDPNHIRDGSKKSSEIIRQTCKMISLLWKKQRGICPLTKRRLNDINAQLDHIIPLKKGGSCLDPSNLRWVHRDVNYAKRDLLDSDFILLCFEVAKVAYAEVGITL